MGKAEKIFNKFADSDLSLKLTALAAGVGLAAYGLSKIVWPSWPWWISGQLGPTVIDPETGERITPKPADVSGYQNIWQFYGVGQSAKQFWENLFSGFAGALVPTNFGGGVTPEIDPFEPVPFPPPLIPSWTKINTHKIFDNAGVLLMELKMYKRLEEYKIEAGNQIYRGNKAQMDAKWLDLIMGGLL